MVMIGHVNKNNVICYRNFSIENKKNSYGHKQFKELVPSKSFYKKWNNDSNERMTYQNLKEYINDYYFDVLKNLNPRAVYSDIGDNVVLLSGNNDDIFSHNMIVAYWLELFLDIDVLWTKNIDGYKIDVNKKRTIVKEILEEVIRKDINTLGYNSLAAYQLQKDSEILLKKAIDLKYANIDNKEVLELASTLLKQAREVENLYNKKDVKKLVK